MIGFLSGTVKFIYGGELILDVRGVGYRIFAGGEFIAGEAAEFFIHTAVSENAINLYGFKTRGEYELFENLLTVSGLGTKTAAAIVAKISPAEFAAAVETQDLKTLTKLPGVGKKSAQRILVELQGKLAVARESVPVVRKSNALDDATDALTALGYTSAEIAKALRRAPEKSTAEQLIKFALREFLKS